MLKIRRSGNGRVVFTLSGRTETEDVEELQQLLALETAGQQLVLDLRNVTVVNQEVVTFLASCEADNITIETCPAYRRDRIERGKSRAKRRRTRPNSYPGSSICWQIVDNLTAILDFGTKTRR